MADPMQSMTGGAPDATAPTPTNEQQDVRALDPKTREKVAARIWREVFNPADHEMWSQRGTVPPEVAYLCRGAAERLHRDGLLAAVSAAAPDEREALSERRIRFAQECADPDFSLSIPWPAKEIISELLAEVNRLDAALAARPAPVVSGTMADAAIEALGMNAYMTPERMTAHHAALGVVWTDPRTVADAPAADDEGGRER